MSTLSTKLFVLAFASVAIASQACTLASPTEVTMMPLEKDGDADDDDDDKPASKDEDSAAECSAKFTKPSTSKLEACGKDRGHCWAKANIPTGMQSMFGAEECSGSDVCVPDEILSAGGGNLKSCQSSVAEAEGACVTRELIVPMMEDKRSAALAKDGCDGDRVCVPCVNPLDKQDSGFCGKLGVLDGACSGGGDSTGTATPPADVELAPCCKTKSGKSNGSCMPADGVPASMKEQVEQQECAGGDMCVPAGMVSKDGPTKCSTMLGNGVCMGECFNSMLSMAGSIGFLSGDGCGDEELCIPCSMAKMQAGDQAIPGCE